MMSDGHCLRESGVSGCSYFVTLLLASRFTFVVHENESQFATLVTLGALLHARHLEVAGHGSHCDHNQNCDREDAQRHEQ